MPKISYVVTSYNREAELQVCLRSLINQRTSSDRNYKFTDYEIIVTDNSTKPVSNRIYDVCKELGAIYVNTKTTDCYSAAEMVIDQAKGEWLCFPSDDNYYVPEFSHRLLTLGEQGCDFVFCNMLYDPRYHGFWTGKYTVVECKPELNYIDKGGFIIKKDLFKKLDGFPGRPYSPQSDADGQLAEAVVNYGAKVGHIKEVMFFHG